MPTTNENAAETAVVVFPVYCQNIPAVVASFLKRLDAKHLILIATYGKISHGNVLWEAQRLSTSTIIAAAYLPMGHSCCNEGIAFEINPLKQIFERIQNPRKITLKKEPKNPLANFFPAWRSRAGIKITRTDACRSCNICGKHCPMGIMQNGVIQGGCIRCLRCVSVCPNAALCVSLHPILKMYLRQNKKSKCTVYL